MNKYELLYIIDKDVSDEQREAQMALVETGIKDGKGTVSKVDKWGMKKFAYTINFKNEGYYVLVSFEAPAEALAELERRMRISDGIVRYMITKVITNKKTEAAKIAKANRPQREAYDRRDDNRRSYNPTETLSNVKEEEAVVEVAEAVETVPAVEEVAVETAAEIQTDEVQEAKE